MATKVFVSFRFNDGKDLKQELEELFDKGTEVLNRSEDVNRSHMTDNTIRKYLYEKIRETSVIIVLLTPEAINYNKEKLSGDYNDWLYDELRYSLQERDGNRTSGVIALYTDESKDLLIKTSSHTCSNCNKTKNTDTIFDFDNLVRKNIMNVKPEFKMEPCAGIYDNNNDSYVSLLHVNTFKKNYSEYIENSKAKRDRLNEFNLTKAM